jgi:hypothetical protein
MVSSLPRSSKEKAYFTFHKVRGWLMGDPLTKLLLSWSQQFCFNKIWGDTPKVGSHVGDDLIIISPCREKLIEHIH